MIGVAYRFIVKKIVLKKIAQLVPMLLLYLIGETNQVILEFLTLLYHFGSMVDGNVEVWFILLYLFGGVMIVYFLLYEFVFYGMGQCLVQYRTHSHNRFTTILIRFHPAFECVYTERKF